MRLRKAVALVTATTFVVSVTIALALIVLTTALDHTTARLATSVERVRLLMELESQALQPDRHGQLKDTVSRLQHRSDPEFVREMERLADMIEVARTSPLIDRDAVMATAMSELRQVVSREDLAARRATGQAAAWNRLANVMGIVGLSVLLVGLVLPVVWFGRRALQPLVAVADAIERFGHGDRAVRVPQAGPAELRRVASSFNEMASALERQHERQLAFVGGVAHDLRNPLSALKVAAALLQRTPIDARRIGERVSRLVEQLERLVNDLLDRTRLEAGQLDLRLDVHDLREIMARVLEDQRELSPARVFTAICPEPNVRLRCDRPRIEQVLQNLLSNAVKYSDGSTDIDIRVGVDDSHAQISVIDHGIGVSDSDRERLFEPFVRGKNVGTVGGIGLGLSVSRKIVDGHGGTIDAFSTPGGGTTFVLRLPLSASGWLPGVRTDSDCQRDTASSQAQPQSAALL
jgi:two-component system sensor histidine kinase MtrB